MSKYTTESDGIKDVSTRSNDSRADEFVSNPGDGGNHCHFYNNKDTGDRGVVHRGACKVCDDNSSESSSDNSSESSSGGK